MVLMVSQVSNKELRGSCDCDKEGESDGWQVSNKELRETLLSGDGKDFPWSSIQQGIESVDQIEWMENV